MKMKKNHKEKMKEMKKKIILTIKQVSEKIQFKLKQQIAAL